MIIIVFLVKDAAQAFDQLKHSADSVLGPPPAGAVDVVCSTASRVVPESFAP